MNGKKGHTLSIIASVIFSSMFTSCSLAPLPNNKFSTATKVLHSNIVGRDYTLTIMLPQNYSQGEDSYPVLYCLDGDLYASDVFNIASELQVLNQIKPVIAVSIGYGSLINDMTFRERDYSPDSWSYIPNTGGASNFFEFIKQELTPYIDGNYRTIRSPEGRCLFGDSEGGLAVAYGFFEYSDVIGNFIMDDPALEWDNGCIFSYESNFCTNTSQTPAFQTNTYRVVVTIGILNYAGWIAQVQSFYNSLNNCNYPNVSLYFSLITNSADGGSVPGAAGFGLQKILQR